MEGFPICSRDGEGTLTPPPPQLFHFTRGDNIEMKNRCSLMERILKMLLLNQFVDHCIDYRVLKQHANDDSISS